MEGNVSICHVFRFSFLFSFRMWYVVIIVKLHSLLCTVTSVIKIFAMIARQNMFRNYQNLTKSFHLRSADLLLYVQNIIVKSLICTVPIVTFLYMCSALLKRASTTQNCQRKNRSIKVSLTRSREIYIS